MSDDSRDGVFISYSHRDREIYEEVRQKLLDREIECPLRDDTDIRPSDQWDPKIQEMMAKASVAVIVFSDHYFRRRGRGQDYILEKELPYLLEHYQQDEIDLLLLYWAPSVHFAPDKPEQVKPFKYAWEGRERSYELHRIQAVVGDGRLARANRQDKLDVLLSLAWEAERRLEERPTPGVRNAEPVVHPERRLLQIQLAVDEGAVHRAFRVGGQTVPTRPPRVPLAQIEFVKASAEITAILILACYDGQDSALVVVRRVARALGSL